MNESTDNIINVNIATMKIAYAPAKLRTILGSCVAVFFYEVSLKLGGMIHILLPECPKEYIGTNVCKYADTGIPALLNEMLKEGANKKNLICKVCGGAKMFSGFGAHTLTDIGARNQTVVLETLSKLGFKPNTLDLGGTTGRKIIADLNTGLIQIEHFNVGEKII